jgi:hypothetical protein
MRHIVPLLPTSNAWTNIDLSSVILFVLESRQPGDILTNQRNVVMECVVSIKQ